MRDDEIMLKAFDERIKADLQKMDKQMVREYASVAYEHILKVFEARLQMKHLLKGTGHRTMSFDELIIILADEIKELQVEVSTARRTKIIEEALDVMISGLLIADKALGEMLE